jgi:FkbM family methyltransferase
MRAQFEKAVDQGAPVYVVGRNTESRALADRLTVSGLVDDRNAGSEFWNGLPIVRMSEIPKSAWVVNCSTSISPVDVYRALVNQCDAKVISLSDLCLGDRPLIEPPWFLLQQREHVRRHLERWAGLHDRLCDRTSRQILMDVLRFRLTGDASYMQSYRVAIDEQYLESFMDYREEVFVDAGGFDGDTTEAFCRIDPAYRSVYLFEPSPVNLLAAKARLRDCKRINFSPLGLSDEPGSLFFDANAGSASTVCRDGSERIEVTTLDCAVKEPVSFIKMDLEGWELRALKGAAGHIRKSQPKLAIAVYHAASDFIEVPAFIDSLGARYQLFLRHYTQGWSETVLYFKPV